MKKLFVLGIVAGFVFAKNEPPVCYTIQIASSKKPFLQTTVKKRLPSICKEMKIRNVYTIRCGCYETYDEAKQHYKSFLSVYPNSMIARTYKFRFGKEYLKKYSGYKYTKTIQKPEKQQKQQNPSLNTKPILDELASVSFEKINKSINVKVPSFPVEKSENEHKNKKNENNQTKPPQHFSISRFYIEPSALYELGQKAKNSSRLYRFRLSLLLGWQYMRELSEHWFFKMEPRVGLKYSDINHNKGTDFNLDLREFYVMSHDLNDNYLNFLIGRKILNDGRAWYYNSSVDTIGFFNSDDLLLYDIYFGGRFNNEKTFTENDNSYGLKDTKFLIAHLKYEYFIRHFIEGFFLLEHTKDLRTLRWYGIRADGNKKFSNSSLKYWADFALLRGNFNQKITANGLDLGAMYNKDTSPYIFGASFARGSGSKDGRHNFYMPYLTNAKHKLNKIPSFRYYGEFLNPDLSNLQIISLYGNYDFKNGNTLSLAIHNYNQIKASKVLRATDMVLTPNGKSKDIGNEFDLIWYFNRPNLKHYKVVFSYFRGGSAFDDADIKEAFYVYFIYRYYF